MNAVPLFFHPTIKYLTVLLAVLLNPQHPNNSIGEPVPFHATYWHDVMPYSHIGRYTNRQRMLDDLQKNVLPGKTRSEIIATLGTSEKNELNRYRKNPDVDTDLVYFLGKQRDKNSGYMSEYLCIYVDESGNYARSVIIGW